MASESADPAPEIATAAAWFAVANASMVPGTTEKMLPTCDSFAVPSYTIQIYRRTVHMYSSEYTLSVCEVSVCAARSGGLVQQSILISRLDRRRRRRPRI